jgi:hypothetical protein
LPCLVSFRRERQIVSSLTLPLSFPLTFQPNWHLPCSGALSVVFVPCSCCALHTFISLQNAQKGNVCNNACTCAWPSIAAHAHNNKPQGGGAAT